MSAMECIFVALVGLSPIWIVVALTLLDRAAEKKAAAEYDAECARHKIVLAAWHKQWTNRAEPTAYRTGSRYGPADDGRPSPRSPVPPCGPPKRVMK